MPRPKRSFGELAEEDLARLTETTRAFHAASREPGTNANRNRFIRYYTELCAARGVRPFPAEHFDVACFLVKYCCDLESVASLSDALSAIRTEAREQEGQVFSPAAEWYLKRVCRGLRKRFRASVQRKRPMTLDILVRLLRAVDLSSLADLQAITMGFLAHDACLRAKELLALRWSDISWEHGPDGVPSGAAICIRISKARYTEAAETVRIPLYSVSGVPACAVQLLWLFHARRPGGPAGPFLRGPLPLHPGVAEAAAQRIVFQARQGSLGVTGVAVFLD